MLYILHAQRIYVEQERSHVRKFDVILEGRVVISLTTLLVVSEETRLVWTVVYLFSVRALYLSYT